MKRYFRNRNGKMIAGVSTGLSDYFGIDPILIRIFFVITFFAHGAGLLAYLLLWIVSDYSPSEYCASDYKTARNSKQIFGYILIFTGGLLLLDYIMPDIDSQITFGIAFLCIGGAIVYKNLKISTMKEQQI